MLVVVGRSGSACHSIIVVNDEINPTNVSVWTGTGQSERNVSRSKSNFINNTRSANLYHAAVAAV